MSEFFVVATPIGNLKDITLRAIEVLREADFILAEDTRKAKILLQHFNIFKPVVSYHQHSSSKKVNQIFKWIKEGKKLALISEAGTPGISDPGNELVSKILQKFGEKIKIVPIPGPSAITAISSVSGFPMHKFLFLGFVPKKKQTRFFQEVISAKYPVIFFESPYRIIKTLSKLAQSNKKLKIVVGRELTKRFETIYYGNIEEVIQKIQQSPIKGEYTVVISPNHVCR